MSANRDCVKEDGEDVSMFVFHGLIFRFMRPTAAAELELARWPPVRARMLLIECWSLEFGEEISPIAHAKLTAKPL